MPRVSREAHANAHDDRKDRDHGQQPQVAPASEYQPQLATGRLLSRIRVGPLLALGNTLSALALAGEAVAPSLWVIAGGFVIFGLGFGVTDSALNVRAMMFAGRAVFGQVAERTGPARVLSGAIVGVIFGAALMTIPGPGFVPVIGIMAVGLAAAPIFPLLTLTTAQRIGAKDVARTTRTVSLQVAASAIGGAALPSGLGLIIAVFSAKALAPSLLVFGITMCGVYVLLTRFARPVPAVARTNAGQ